VFSPPVISFLAKVGGTDGRTAAISAVEDAAMSQMDGETLAIDY